MKSLLLFFLLIPQVFYSQIIKTEKIFSSLALHLALNSEKTYNTTNELISTSIVLSGKDDRFHELYETIILFQGSPVDFYKFIKSCEDFYNTQTYGTSMELSGHTIAINKLVGIKSLYIYENSGNGYTILSNIAFNKINSKFEKWAIKNKVAYK